MKRFLFGFLAVLFLILNTIPYLHIMADQSMTDSQLKQVGAFALSSLITTGEATELDFSDYTDSDTDFLLALGELVVTGDPTGLIDCGLDWLGGEIDDSYDSAIQSIREWEYNMSPTLYYWFVDTQPPYELSPTYNSIRDLSQPLRRLFTPPDDNNSPQPDLDYQFYLDFINGSGFFFSNWSNRSIDNTGGNITQFFPYYNYSYVSTDGTPPVMNGTGDNWQSAVTSPISVYINSLNNQYFYTYNSTNIITGYYYGDPMYGIQFRTNNQGNPQYIGPAGAVSGNYTYTSGNFTSLTELFSSLERRVKNVNIYVDSVPWSLPFETITYPIVIPDQLTIWNDQPLTYDFPPDTYLKLPDLTNIITNAINNSGVVMWSDIADCFVDVNGQTAVAVTKIVRNDYDNLYMEQYPYPAMLIGMTDQTKFNEHLLDNSHAYLSPMGTVVQETVNVLPSELVGVLAIGAILTIFAVIINRLLE